MTATLFNLFDMGQDELMLWTVSIWCLHVLATVHSSIAFIPATHPISLKVEGLGSSCTPILNNSAIYVPILLPYLIVMTCTKSTEGLTRSQQVLRDSQRKKTLKAIVHLWYLITLLLFAWSIFFLILLRGSLVSMRMSYTPDRWAIKKCLLSQRGLICQQD